MIFFIYVPWRRSWPRFDSYFYFYGGRDITNHVKHHWKLIKYIILQSKANHSLRDLIVAII